MSKLFHPDSKLMQLGYKLVQLIEVGLLMLLCCIPVITIGPAVSAMHYVLLHIYRDDIESIGKTFWKSFRENLRQGILLTVLYLLAFSALLYTCYLISFDILPNNKTLLAVLVLMAAVASISCVWVFILLSRYRDKTVKVIRNSIIMLFGKPIYSVVLLSLSVIPLLAVIFLTQFLPLVLALGFSGCGYFQTMLYSRVFDMLEGVNKKTETEALCEAEEQENDSACV